MKNSEIAFEEEFQEKDIHKDLWRLISTRKFNDRPLRHINWFISEGAAKRHAKWIEDENRGTVINISHYRLVND